MQFEPLTSAVEPSLWHALAKLKLDVLRLSDAPVDVCAHIAPGRTVKTSQSSRAPLPACILLDGTSLDPASYRPPPAASVVPGMLKNTNTIEEFKALDKQRLFAECAERIWADITSGHALADPRVFLRFLLVTFADLKKHKFIYWFAFPALTSPAPTIEIVSRSSVRERFGESVSQLAQIVREHAQDLAFLVVSGGSKHHPLSELPLLLKEGREITVVLADPSARADTPGWPARNLLVALAHYGVRHLQFVCARADLLSTDAGSSSSEDLSVVWDICLGELPNNAAVKAGGWERHADGKLAPRQVDLAHMMDPKRLADDAVHLNLKLMKWRALPALDLNAVSSSRCLLVGAGTLGCYVARTLLAWGVHHITFVDAGKVSFSNPVRQPLFTFADCLDGGRDKALAAAERLRDILPTVDATGYTLSVPMPGHPVLSEASFRESVATLDALVRDHDTVFLLTDSRESRWLPTVLGKAHSKIIINAALGFDSYVVMRHGDELGCYFCNDVVAPTDSLTDRTLDQMCTVTRPGLAAIAGATAVEMLASILNHNQRTAAPANSTGVLGKVPHQVRGFLGSHETMLIAGQAYDRCTACSAKIIDLYRTQGAEFVRSVCNDPATLERVTGLDALQRETEEGIDAWADEEDDEM